MARKSKPSTKSSNGKPNELPIVQKPGEDDALTVARAVLRPTVQGSLTLRQYNHSKFPDQLELGAMIKALREQTELVNEGELGRGEAMLAAQAHTLDAMFNKLAQMAMTQEWFDNFQALLKLSFRAQSQCRATWEALSGIKNPPVIGYARQANVAQGHQQVNNGSTSQDNAPPAVKCDNARNELLEQTDGRRLDTGAAGTTGEVDPRVAAMATIHRSDNG